MELDQEERKRIIELALVAARRRQRKQTGFVHFCYESDNDYEHDTIPLLENACFALALFRSRVSEQIVEGKALLEKILPFQFNGNFPVYLHEYPQCRDRTLAIHMLPALYWIFSEFQLLLGEELKIKLENAIQAIVDYGLKVHAERPLPKQVAVKLNSFAKSFEQLDWVPENSQDWGDLLIALQMAAPHVNVERYIHQAARHWHPNVLTYVGTHQHHYQEKTEPQLTLYDLFMGQLYSKYSKRALKDHPIHLQAALIYPFPVATPTDTAGSHYLFQKHDEGLSLVWGDADHAHSLAIFWKPDRAQAEVHEKEARVLFTFTEPPKEEDAVEAAFYCNIHSANQLFVEGQKASVFHLRQTVEIRSEEISLQVTFSLKKGEGNFVGHFVRGNRPTQLQKRGGQGFEAYDWRVGLRTLGRTSECQIEMCICVVAGSP